MAQENCSHDCESCQQKCSEAGKPDFRVAANALSDVKKVIGVVSGKGGVGKSLVTSLLASAMQKKGRQCGILDADITGPSIPKMFGVDAMAAANESGILPCRTKGGIDIMSVNLLMEDKATPVIWRGPAIAEVVKQFWSDVIWSYEDYLFVDMPPGTGDVPLTVFQSLPVDGIVIVASPQELVSLIVEKALRMAKEMNIPILGVIENMSYVQPRLRQEDKDIRRRAHGRDRCEVRNRLPGRNSDSARARGPLRRRQHRILLGGLP